MAAMRNPAFEERLYELFPAIHAYIFLHSPDSIYHERVLKPHLDTSPTLLNLLPMAACIAAGGRANQSISLAASWQVFQLGIRILDDLQDQDRPTALWARIGLPEATNYAFLLCVHCLKLLQHSPDAHLSSNSQLVQQFLDDCQTLLEGQEEDLVKRTPDFDAYWKKIEKKNARIFEWGCRAGAQCGSDSPQIIQALRQFGYHLGILLQLLDDYQGIWEANGVGDLGMGKYTYPLVFGLNHPSDHQEDIGQLAANPAAIIKNEQQIRELLDLINAQNFVVWTVYQEGEKALNCLRKLPYVNDGIRFLSDYIKQIFSHLPPKDDLLP
ncbi:MAG: polyprenyl synthetase family protein [Bacteroidota bacterium]